MKRPWLEANGNTFAYRKLIHVASLKARIGWQSLRTDEFVDEGPYCVTGTDFQNGKINWSTAYHVSKERYEMDRNIQLKEGDLLVTKDGTIGKVAVVHGLDAPATLNSGVFVVRPKTDELSTDFLGWVVRSKVFDDFVAFNFSGSTINHLYQNVFETFRFPFPDLAIQRQIADFLDRETERIDLLIEKKQRLVALLGEKARSVIDQATTTGFSKCETQESGEKWLGQVAAHWRVTPLKWFTRLQSGFAFKADRFGEVGTPLVRMNNLKRGVLDLNEAACIADEDINISVILRNGDILIGMSGSIGETGSLGNFAVVVEDNLPCLLNQRVGRFQFVGDELLPDYLILVIQSASFLDPIFLAATSTAQFNVSPSQVGSIMFALPPIAEQCEIVVEVRRRIGGLTEAKGRTLLSIDRLKEYRSALITAAVTGQIDVSTHAKSGTSDRRLDAIQEEMDA